MNRKIYTQNREISLVEYCPQVDDSFQYECWQDPAVQEGYNYKMNISLDEFRKRPIRSRLLAVIIRNEDSETIGTVSLSPEGSPPDLAIMLHKSYRGQGYGKSAFALAAKYCMEAFNLERIYAGCYETNTVSLKMLKSCGFIPYPDGDSHETHYLTDEPITQLDFVFEQNEH